jgi:hypothetical protein
MGRICCCTPIVASQVGFVGDTASLANTVSPSRTAVRYV